MVFRFPKTLDPITLFHSPSLQSSTKALNILKSASAAASAADSPVGRGEFQLEITTAPPTTDQLRNILDYVSGDPSLVGKVGGPTYAVSEIVKGAKNAEDAVKKFKEDETRFVRPITVDWTNGQAVVGDNESEILKMVRQANE
ncbi:thioredoxin-like protein [Aspergillus pseudodeflectus]|uniref:Thioredoxin-like protein n=1 Tax=Aspergillus pseudodeflectus TaxID=176178 RepID=A0ABR4K2B8_9EURO